MPLKLKPIRTIHKILAGLAAAFIVGGGCFLFGMQAARPAQSVPEITASLISQRLTPAAELATVKYFYTEMGRFEESSDFYGWKVPFTKKVFIISYNGTVKAGVDLQQMRPELQQEQQKVIIHLPKVKILSHEVDEDSIEVFDESRNIFNPIRITDYTQFSSDQREKTENQAIQNGLLEEAERKTQEVIRGLIGDLLPEGWEIDFQTIEN